MIRMQLKHSITSLVCVVAVLFCCERLVAQHGRVEISVPAANLYDGAAAVGAVQAGQQFQVKQVNGSWLLITAPVNGTMRQLWIRDIDTRPATAATLDAGSTDKQIHPRDVLRVKVDSANVMLGSEVVATVRRGTLFPRKAVNGRYYAVRVRDAGVWQDGWILDSFLEIRDASFAGPSLAGNSPASAVEPDVRVDWASNRVVLTLPPLDVNTEPRLVPPHNVSISDIESRLENRGSGLSIALSDEELSVLRTPGSRSLWVEATVDRKSSFHRIDLPAPLLQTTLANHPESNSSAALLIDVPVSNLQPGFTAEYAITRGAGEPTAWRTLSRKAEALPRLADVYHNSQGDHLRIALASRPGIASSGVFAFRVRNPDGSLSNSIGIAERGGVVDTHATLLREAQPAPVDATVRVPDVEVLPYAQAAASLVQAGLLPKLVDDSTLEPLSLAVASAKQVLRQGIPAGEPVLVGESIVVTVAQLPSESSELLGSQQLPAPADTMDDLGFADIFHTEANLGAAVNDSALAATLAKVGLPESVTDNAIGILLERDPGVSLDPERNAKRTQAAAVLKLLIDSLVQQPTWKDLPGAVGAAITAGITEHERELQYAISGESRDSVASLSTKGEFEDLADTIVSQLSIELDQASRNALASHLAQFTERRWSAELLDRNANGLVADDVVVCGIIWLFEQQHYDPFTNIVVVPGADGANVAMLSKESHSTDWISSLLPQLFLPNGLSSPEAAVTPLAGDPTRPLSDRPLPEAKPIVTVRRGPDTVRVPPLEGQLAGDAERSLRDLNLVLIEPNKFFMDDRITQVTPESNTWVPSGTSVRIGAVRRVPDLVNLSKLQAEAEAVRFSFALRARGPALPGDVVLQQQPESGTFVEIGSRIDVDVVTIVPSVVGSLLADAVTTLDQKGLAWQSSTKGFRSDKVVGQSPAAGALVEPGQQVVLDLHMATPNVLGMTLRQARQVLDDYDLQSDVENSLALDQDVVRGQNPQPGTYVPHRANVALGPLFGVVPDVRGITVGRARQILADGNYTGRSAGESLDDELVTFQTPDPGTELERGSLVDLDVRVPIPDVREQLVGNARQIIQSADGRLQFESDSDFGRRDIVLYQDPTPGELVYPGSIVRVTPGVVVPDVEGLPPQRALQVLANYGLSGRAVTSGTEETANPNLAGTTVVEGQRPNAGIYPRSGIGEVELALTHYILAQREVPRVAGVDRVAHLDLRQAIDAIKQRDLVPIIVVEGRELNETAFAVFALAFAATHDGANLFQTWPESQYPAPGTLVPVGTRVTITPFMGR